MCKAIATGQQCLCNRQQRSRQCRWHAVTRCAEPAWTRCRCASARSTAPSSASPVSTHCPSTQLCSSSSGVARCQPGAQSHIQKNPNLPHPRYRALPTELDPEEVEPYRLALRWTNKQIKNCKLQILLLLFVLFLVAHVVVLFVKACVVVVVVDIIALLLLMMLQTRIKLL